MTQQPSPDIDLNGELIAAEAARISPFDRGFTLGDGIFESLRVRGGAPEFLAEHLARLRRAAAVLALPLPFDDAEMGARMARLIAANDMPEGAMRLTVSRGAAARGVATPPAADCRPTVILSLHPLPSTRHAPVAAIVATVTRRNERSPLSGIKAAPYLDNILALDEAKARGAQDAILLNTSGRVASACYANLFAVIDGRLVTPPLADGPLPGPGEPTAAGDFPDIAFGRAPVDGEAPNGITDTRDSYHLDRTTAPRRRLVALCGALPASARRALGPCVVALRDACARCTYEMPFPEHWNEESNDEY